MDKEVLIKYLKVMKNTVFTEKEIISSTKSGHQEQKESVYLEISTTGTENSINAKEYDNY